MKVAHFPFCCTSAVLGSLGEHGEPSVVSVAEIKKIVKRELVAVKDLGGVERGGHMRCIFAVSVNPENVAMLKQAGFVEVDSYEGIQGTAHILTLHI